MEEPLPGWLCLPGGVPYSPCLALRVGEGQSWVKCLVQKHNVAAAGSDAVGIRITDPLDHKFRMLLLAPLRLTALCLLYHIIVNMLGANIQTAKQREETQQ